MSSSVSYKPIPYSASDTATASITLFTDWNTCTGSGDTYSKTTTVSVSESESPLQYSPIVESRWRNADTSGIWSKIKESGEIKMTPMSVGFTRVTNQLGSCVKDKHGFAFPVYGCGGSNCNLPVLLHSIASASINYIEQGDLTYWRQRFPDAPYLGIEPDFDEARWERIKSQAYQDLFQAYNLGEELYELKETILQLTSLLKRAYLLLSKFKETLRRLRNLRPAARAKAIAKAWLELRYGLMPIAYSIQDILNLVNDSEGGYRTIRRKYEPPTKPTTGSYPDGDYFYEIGAMSTVYRVTVKGRWANSDQKKRDLVNINLLTTALAVFKYSLVVRWFINLNSVIDSWVKSFTTSALEFNGVVSVRVKRDVAVFFHHVHDSRKGAYFNGDDVKCGPGFFEPAGPYTIGQVSTFNMKLQNIEEDTYERELFLPTDARFVWDPNMNLKRYMDALALIISRFLRL